MILNSIASLIKLYLNILPMQSWFMILLLPSDSHCFLYQNFPQIKNYYVPGTCCTIHGDPKVQTKYVDCEVLLSKSSYTW